MMHASKENKGGDKKRKKKKENDRVICGGNTLVLKQNNTYHNEKYVSQKKRGKMINIPKGGKKRDDKLKYFGYLLVKCMSS